MSVGDPYRPAPLTPEQEAANDEIMRRIIAALYADEGRPMSAALRAQMRRADRMARALTRVDQQKRGRL